MSSLRDHFSLALKEYFENTVLYVKEYFYAIALLLLFILKYEERGSV